MRGSAELTRGSRERSRQVAIIVLLICVTVLNAAYVISIIGAQVDPRSLAFQAFTGLADVYKRGGEAPDLVAKLNTAITLIQQAQMKRNTGDEVGAAALENQARTEIAEVIEKIPAAQQATDRANETRSLTAILLIPMSVAVSSFIFFVALRTWRTYERLKLHEMRIIEKTQAQG